MDDIELRLLAGMPVEIEGLGRIYSPTLNEITEIGVSKYNEYLSVLLFDKDSLEEIASEELTSFQVFCVYCYHNEDFKSIVMKAINFFLKEEAHFDLNDQDVFFSMLNGRLDETNFDLFQRVMRIANMVEKSENEQPIKAGNERAAKFMEKLKQLKKEAPKKKESITLHSIINGVAWKAKGINVFNVFDLTIYRLKLGFSTLENIDNYSFTLQGIYSGNVDAKNIKFDRIHWAKVLKTNY